MSSYAVVPDGGSATEYTRTLHATVKAMARAAGMDSGWIHGTHAVGYHDDKRCAGHHIARVYVQTRHHDATEKRLPA